MNIQEYRQAYQEAGQELQKRKVEADTQVVDLGRIKFRPVGYQQKARVFYKNASSELNQRQDLLNQEVYGVESDVAAKNPEEALPDFRQREYDKVAAQVQDRISSVDSQIKAKQERIAELTKEFQTTEDPTYEANLNLQIEKASNDLDMLQEKRRGYEESLSGDQATVIRKFNSGYTDELADFYSEKTRSSQELTSMQKMLEKQENTTLVYQNNKWTGQVINTMELPVELQKKRLDISDINNFNSKVEKSRYEQTKLLDELKNQGYEPVFDNSGNIAGVHDLNSGQSYAFDAVNQNKKFPVINPTPSSAENATEILTFGFGGMTGKAVAPVVSNKEAEFNIYTEVQRYQDFGYSPEEAKTLARASAAKGGVTFAPDFADKLIETQKIKNQQFIDLVLGNGNKKPDIKTLQGELGQDVFSSTSSSNNFGVNFNIGGSSDRFNSSKLRGTGAGYIGNLDNSLVNQSANRTSSSQDQDLQSENAVGSFFGWVRTGLKKFTGELGIPIMSMGTIGGGIGGDIKVTDIKEDFSRTAQETFSDRDLQKSQEAMNLEWQKSVQNLDINPYTNEWIGSEEGYNAYQAKNTKVEQLKKDIEAKSYWQRVKASAVDWGVDSFNKFAPESYGEFALDAAVVYGGIEVGGAALNGASKLPVGVKAVGRWAFRGVDWIGTGLAVKEGLNKENDPFTQVTNFGFAGLGAIGAVDDVAKGYGWARSKYLPGDVKYVTDLSVDESKALRDRATILIKDSRTGKYLVELDKNTGMYITPGGAVDKGEDYLKAAQRELFEETGIKVNPSELKFSDDFITSRERYKVFTYEIEDAAKLNLQAQAKEVAAFKWVDAPEDYTGATTIKPFGQKANPLKFWENSVRSDDLYALSRANKVSDVNKEIKSFTAEQRLALAQEAKLWAETNFPAERLKGISDKQLLKDYLLNQRQGLFQQLIVNPAEETFYNSQVGEELYLSKRVKAVSWKSPGSWFDWAAGRKPGQFKKFQQYPGIEVGFGSRYDISFDVLEEYRGKKMAYVHGSAGQIPTQTEVFGDLEGWNIKNVKFEETFEVMQKANQRGEGVLYFQPPTKAKGGQAYLGASYLGLLDDASSGKPIKLSWFKRNPNIYTANAVAGDDLIFTKKAIAGVEFEVGALPGTVFKVTGKGRNVWLAGRKVKNPYLDLMENAPDEILRGWQNFGNMNSGQQGQFLKGVKKQTGVDYSQFFYNYVDPSDFIGDFAGSFSLSAISKGRPSGVRSPTKRAKGSSAYGFSEDPNASPIAMFMEGYEGFVTKEPKKVYYKEPRKPSTPYAWNGGYDFPVFEPIKIPTSKKASKQFNPGRKLTKKELAMLYKRQNQYAPSMTAVILGITEPIQNIKEQDVYSGFELRPLPEMNVPDPFGFDNPQPKRRRKRR